MAGMCSFFENVYKVFRRERVHISDDAIETFVPCCGTQQDQASFGLVRLISIR